jgi:hypothetical protein
MNDIIDSNTLGELKQNKIIQGFDWVGNVVVAAVAVLINP